MSALGLVPDPTGATVAVDGGQSGLRLRVADAGGVRTAEVPGFAYAVDSDPAAVVGELLRHAVAALPSEIGSPRGGVRRAALGLTGAYDDPAALAELARLTAELTGATEVRIAHDSVTAHLGAFGGEPGVVVAAGTGTVALAIPAVGEARRVDGWGYLLGDGGGGFAVGRAALRAACAAADGRGPSTALLDVVGRRFGELRSLPATLYRSPTMVADVAALTADVAESARAGDQVARAIWERAVDDLVATAVAAAHGQPGGPLCGVGGMFAVTDLVAEPWARGLADRLPGCRVVPPAGSGLDGAELLARARELGRVRPLLWYAEP